jgi:transcriptional regulator with XRE-family HTH domain
MGKMNFNNEDQENEAQQERSENNISEIIEGTSNHVPTQGEIFAANLNELLEERDVSQTDLAQLTNIPKTSINRYVRGKIPKPDRLEKIAYIFGSSIESLISDHHGETSTSSHDIWALSDDEKDLIMDFRSVNSQLQGAVRQILIVYRTNCGNNI